MKVGFTGTRDGLTSAQRTALELWLYDHSSVEPIADLHHGDCVGADAAAHIAATEYGFWIVIHPPSDERLRAHCAGDEVREAKPYLERNRDIVDETDMLVACPKEGSVALSSGGTFYTIRYALKRAKTVLVIWPDGELDDSQNAAYEAAKARFVAADVRQGDLDELTRISQEIGLYDIPPDHDD